MNQSDLNMLYNSVDYVISNSDAQGFGLATAQGLMSGTPMMATAIGGLQDQMRFQDENGNWIDFSHDFPSNCYGQYPKHAKWAHPFWTKSTKIAGSHTTPYIYYMYTSKLEIIQALIDGYNTSPQDRKKFGLQAREWMMGDQSKMSSSKLCQSVIKDIDTMFKNYKPRNKFDLIKFKQIKPLEWAGTYDEYTKKWS